MPDRADALRDLMFVLVGLETGLIERDSLVGAFRSWDTGGPEPLADQVSREAGIPSARRAELDRLVADRLRRTGTTPDPGIPTLTTQVSPTEVGPGAPDPLAPTVADLNGTLPIEGAGTSAPAGSQFGSPTADGARFRIIRAHAQGGLGVVSLAADAELNREVALKQIKKQYADDPTSRSRFLLEAEITGGLEHPGIVPVYGLGVDAEGRPYYAMRFIRGESLRAAISRFHLDPTPHREPGARSLEFRKLLHRFQDVCNTIDYAHGRGVLHRDIKPDNVMIGRYGETLVVDWGIAKALGRPDPGLPAGEKPFVPKSGGDATATLPGSAIGTPAYMSPEQAAGDLENLGPPSDVYSLGATLYCLLTGRPPIELGDLRSMIRAVERAEFDPPRKLDSRIHPSLEAICLKAMAFDPEDRYPTARALGEDIERWMADEPVTARDEPRLERLRRWSRQHRSFVTAAAAVVLMAVVGLSVVLGVQARANQDLRAANERVQDQFELAMDAIKTFHTGVSEDLLLKEDQFQELRNRLLSGARDFYGRLEAMVGGRSDPDSQAALGLGLYEVGDLTSSIGSKQDALNAHRRALEIRRRLAEEPDPSGLARRDLARSLAAIAGLLLDLGRADDARANAEESIGVIESALADRPDDPDLISERSRALYSLALILKDSAEGDRALDVLDRAIAGWTSILGRSSDPDEIRRRLGMGYNEIGTIHRARRDYEPALIALEQAQAIRRDLVDRNPESSQMRLDLSNTLNNRARTLLALDRHDEAFQVLEDSLEIRRDLVREFPAVTSFQNSIAHSYHQFGRYFRDAEDYERALAQYDLSLAVREALVEANPSVKDFQGDLAAVLTDKAVILENLGELEASLAIHRRSRDIEQGLIDREVNDPRVLNNASISFLHIAGLLDKLGRAAEAEASFEDARDFLQGMIDADNADSITSEYLGTTLLMLGQHRVDMGRPLDALRAYEDASRIYDSLIREAGQAGDAQQAESVLTSRKVALASALGGMASIRIRVGPIDQGESELFQARDVLASILDQDDPNVAELRAEIDERLCELYGRRGQPELALKANAAAEAIRSTLAEAHPKDPRFRRMLVDNRLGRAEQLARAGDRPAALEAARAALADAAGLTARYPKVIRYRSVEAECLLRAGLLERDEDPKAAADALRRAVALLGEPGHEGSGDLALLARAQAALASLVDAPASGVVPGEARQAVEAAVGTLRRAVAAGYRDIEAVNSDPALAPVRARPAFLELLTGMVPPIEPGP